MQRIFYHSFQQFDINNLKKRMAIFRHNLHLSFYKTYYNSFYNTYKNYKAYVM